MKRFLFGLLIVSLATSMALVGCGDDDKPTQPDPPDEPIGLFSVHGDTLLAVMGASTINPPLVFKVNDSSRQGIGDVWIRLVAVSGDGTLGADSVQTDSTGLVEASYTFDGVLGYARIVAIHPQYGADTVNIRADVLTPGPGGQGQYVRFTDVFNDIVNLNGEQEGTAVDPRVSVPIWYIEYESSQGLVFMLLEADRSRFYPTSPVWGVIVNSVYDGATVNGIGIGSSFDEIIAEFGQPNEIFRDPLEPPALVLNYTDVPPGNMQFFLDTVAAGSVDTNTTAFEIHMSEAPQPPDSIGVESPPWRGIPATKSAGERGYRLYTPR